MPRGIDAITGLESDDDIASRVQSRLTPQTDGAIAAVVSYWPLI